LLPYVNVFLPYGNIITEMIVSEQIRNTRKLKGLKARDLARLAGVSPAEISRLESAHRDPRSDTLQRIAAALEVSVSFLLQEEDEELDLPIAIKRQALRKFQKTAVLTDSEVTRLVALCVLDSAPKSVQEWKDFVQNAVFYNSH
jgi:transcriptional regulator with XRE-family HTH domain